MTGVWRKTRKGIRMFIHACEVCGSDNAPFGFRVPGQPSRWYCARDRQAGEQFIGGNRGD